MKLAAVIVTRNRLNTLKNCIDGLRRQSKPFESIIVVNNLSTDGTTEWLNQQQDLIVLHQSANYGSSGGFYEGYRYATEVCSVDWVFASDDDVIMSNENVNSTFEEIVNSFDQHPIAISTTQILKDGNEVTMSMRYNYKKKILEDLPIPTELRLVKTEIFSLAGVFVNSDAIRKVGLPRKEFFISYDDAEFSLRLSKVGSIYSCKDLKVHHSFEYMKGVQRTRFGNVLYSPEAMWRKFYTKRNLYLTLLSVDSGLGVYVKIFEHFLKGSIFDFIYYKNRWQVITIEIAALRQALTGKLSNDYLPQ